MCPCLAASQARPRTFTFRIAANQLTHRATLGAAGRAIRKVQWLSRPATVNA